MIRKPMLASNYDADKLVFPIGVQPKIDGVRGLNMDGTLTGRSLKTFGNKHITARFSKPDFVGLDGEFAADRETHPRLCSLTSSAMSANGGKDADIMWHVFDMITEETVDLPYRERYAFLHTYINDMQTSGNFERVRVVPMVICHMPQQVESLHQFHLDSGYEGTILRSLSGKHKAGRSTVREGGLLRIKDFDFEEAMVIGITEGRVNNNEQQTNELGRSFRTSHQDNQTPNGMVGSLECEIINDSELFTKGQSVTVSKGEMTHEEAKYYFENPSKIVGQKIKFKHFPKGVKVKPRFPTFHEICS